MTIEPRARLIEVFRRMVCIMLVVPVVFLILYPLYYLSLPASWQMIADLPQDFLLVLIVEGVIVPAVLLCGYARERFRRHAAASGTGNVFPFAL